MFPFHFSLSSQQLGRVCHNTYCGSLVNDYLEFSPLFIIISIQNTANS